MTSGRTSHRWAFWALAAALLLKAAMPWLAQAAAQQQGRSLVEVCTVYGVALVQPAGDAHPPPGEPASTHAGDHCALTALTALATGGASAPLPTVAAFAGAAPVRVPASSSAADACAAWAARLAHAPPPPTA